MKKLLRFAGLVTGIVLTLGCAAAASAAVVDKTPPYEGEYFIAYNDHIGYPSGISSGPLPVALLDEEGVESARMVEYDVFDMWENENGETVYRLEPRNLEERITPPTASTFRRSAPVRRSEPAQRGDEREFITVDMQSNESVPTPFVLKYVGEYCNIWLERNDVWDITDEMVTELGMEYDVEIHNKMTTDYGPIYDRDKNGKLTILLYDIQDGFKGSGGYVGGFFMPGDLRGDDYNCMDVIHIDTYPSIKFWKPAWDPLAEVKSTMVHELQHLIEESYCVEHRCDRLPTWVNEGLSMAAEHMIYGVLESRIDYYNEDAYWNTPLADWREELQDSLSNYAYSYLFFQYLRTQTKNFAGGGEELFRYILQSEKRSALCVEQGMKQFFPYISIGDIFRNFHIALTLNEPTGLYGFAGESDFVGVKPKLYPRSGDKVNLGNGAAIVKKMESGSYTPDEAAFGYVRYAAFTPGGRSVDAPVSSVVSGEVYKYRTITLSCSEQHATMYYTMDGSEPDENSLIYNGRPIQILSDATLKAITITQDGEKSSISTYQYTVVEEDVELFRRTVGDAYDQDALCVLACPDGGIIKVGTYPRDSAGTSDFYELYTSSNSYRLSYVAKYDQNGAQVWIHTFGGNWVCQSNDAVSMEDGFVLVGYNTRFANKSHTGDFEGLPIWDNEYNGNNLHPYAFLAKLDWDGNVLWTKIDPFISDKKYDHGNIYKIFNGVGLCPDGGIVAAGGTEVSNSNFRYSFKDYSTAYIVKTDSQGNYLWQHELSGGDVPCGFFDVAVLNDGTIVAVGYAREDISGSGDWADYPLIADEPSKGHTVPIIVAYAQDGALLWKKAFPFDEKCDCFWFVRATDSGIVTTSILEDKNALIACFDADPSGCELRWEDHNLIGHFPIIEVAEDGILAVFNGSVDNPYGFDLKEIPGHDVIVAKYDWDGQVVWMSQYGSNFIPNSGQHTPYAIAPLGNRKYAVSGNTWYYYTPYGERVLYPHGFLFTFYDESIPYYTVSGNVGLPGVSIGGKLSDSQGNYTVKVMQGERVTLTPSLPGYTFEAPSRTVGPVTEPVTGIDFTPTEVKYTLRGRVLAPDGTPLPGVAVAKDVITGADGSYSLTVRPGVNILLNPQAEGKTFTPLTITKTGVSKNEDGLDFRALKPKYTISGKVTRSGTGQGGVEVFKGVLTEPDGTYSFTVEEGTSVTLMPRFQRYTFDPVTAPFGAVTENHEQDFIMLPLPCLLQATPNPVKFETLAEDYVPPEATTVTVKNVEGDPCTGITVFLEKDCDFEVSALSGDTVAVGDGGVTFTVRPKAGLAKSEHTATVQIRQGEMVLLTVPVTFTVEEKPAPEVPDKPDPKPDDPKPDDPKPEEPKPDKPAPSTPSTGESSEVRPTVGPKEEKPVAMHTAYLQGYPDGGFHPDDSMTRAQCATMLARLDPDFDPEKAYPAASFSDAGADRWFANYLSFVRQKGIVNGYPDGTFRPDAPMTRGEFAMVVRNILGLESNSADSFSDTENHWARYPIAQLVQAGILDGYPDGTFRPDAPISRAEAAKVLNRAYQRSLESRPAGDAPSYSDLTESHWAYYEIWEASVEHPVSLFHPEMN